MQAIQILWSLILIGEYDPGSLIVPQSASDIGNLSIFTSLMCVSYKTSLIVKCAKINVRNQFQTITMNWDAVQCSMKQTAVHTGNCTFQRPTHSSNCFTHIIESDLNVPILLTMVNVMLMERHTAWAKSCPTMMSHYAVQLATVREHSSRQAIL